MYKKLMVWLMCVLGMISFAPAYSQLQSCPANINFASGDISFWGAKTGLIGNGSINYPAPNNGVTTIPEYTIATTGIKVNTTSTSDPYGGFSTIPVINGYSYGYSVKIGSTATSYDLRRDPNGPTNPGGFLRSLTYNINVPAGPTTVPYTMTYAYAMVLENGTHNSNEQPLFKATLVANGNTIQCASPEYYLPTFNNANQGGGTGGTGATLDSAAAIANGFSNSPLAFLSHAGTNNSSGTLLNDVWTKGWTEVTFDLSPYRGQLVTLTFEADNCVPGAHFAYAYVALRNSCGGLQISGNPVACQNASSQYSVPSLAGATYNWTVPAGWTINSGNSSNIINVTPGASAGLITVNEKNSCANLNDTINVSTSPPTVPGKAISDNTVCSGTNSTALTLNGSVGNVLNWLSSTDGVIWNIVMDTTTTYSAQNLTSTTQYRALVQNGAACSIDSSAAATITVDPKSVGGTLSPNNQSFCLGQNQNSALTLTGSTGSIVDWQRSNDNINWSNFSPVKNDSSYNVNNINADVEYRVITKSGVCPPDTSSVASIHFINVPFPNAAITPDSASICYGKTASLSATISNGTSYTWTHASTLNTPAGGTINSLPFTINSIASPTANTDYVLTVNNSGCPNPLLDTFHVAVSPKIVVFAGNDTSIVAGQPLQLHATVSDSSAYQFNWSPGTGLNFTTVPDPVATFSAEQSGGTVTYTVRATNVAGCYGEDDITVKLFKTGPDIFVPSGFTPNGDGRNDILRPICVGIKELNFFRIYNRWGQLVFSTKEIGKGWDGTISGQPQSTANFVYMAEGVDFNGKTIFKKGNVMLVR